MSGGPGSRRPAVPPRNGLPVRYYQWRGTPREEPAPPPPEPPRPPVPPPVRDPGAPRVRMWRDDSLPHQIVLYLIGSSIAVSCNCMRGVDGRQPSPFEVRTRWEPGEAPAVWRAHLAGPEAVAS
jgi:hypothetical protein